MRHILRGEDGFEIKVGVEEQTLTYIHNTSFRGTACHKAGNFLLWNSLSEFLEDSFIQKQLLEECRACITEKTVRPLISIEYPHIVGWSPVDERRHYEPHQLRLIRVTHQCEGWQIIRCNGCRPQQTRHITMRIHLDYGGSFGWTCVIRSVYPGPYIGNLRKQRITNVVFFDRDCQGDLTGLNLHQTT